MSESKHTTAHVQSTEDDLVDLPTRVPRHVVCVVSCSAAHRIAGCCENTVEFCPLLCPDMQPASDQQHRVHFWSCVSDNHCHPVRGHGSYRNTRHEHK